MHAKLDAMLAAAGLAPNIVASLASYAELILEANRTFNLTGAKSADALVPHLLDSLTVAPFVTANLVDVGSGAGLPAIPVAIATGVPVTLIESNAKKARFLRHALDALGLVGEVVTDRAETAARDERLRDAFACGTARAVSSAPTVAELLLPFIRPGGIAILQRGAMEERERAALTDAALMLAAEIGAEHQLGGDHRIVIVHKRGVTPARFPRRTGIPEKRPLCM